MENLRDIKMKEFDEMKRGKKKAQSEFVQVVFGYCYWCILPEK